VLSVPAPVRDTLNGVCPVYRLTSNLCKALRLSLQLSKPSMTFSGLQGVQSSVNQGLKLVLALCLPLCLVCSACYTPAASGAAAAVINHHYHCCRRSSRPSASHSLQQKKANSLWHWHPFQCTSQVSTTSSAHCLLLFSTKEVQTSSGVQKPHTCTKHKAHKQVQNVYLEVSGQTAQRRHADSS